MKHLFFSILGIISLVTSYQETLAQLALPKFEAVATDDFDPTLAARFPNAPAVILMDYGEVAFEMGQSGRTARYHYFRRILVLKDPEPGMGNVEIIFNQKGNEKISHIKAYTYNLNSVDKPIAFKLDKRRIERTKGEGSIRKVSFQLPFVKKGSIIEFQYSINTAEMETLKSWEFQRELPVLRSEYHTMIPELLDFVVIGRGNLNGLRKSRDYFYQNIRMDNRGGYNLYVSHDIYVMEEVRGFKRERFMPAEKDILPQISFIRAERNARTPVTRTWEQLNQSLVSGKEFAVSRSLASQIDEIARNIGSDERGKSDKIQAIYEYVSSEFTWNGVYQAVPKNVTRAFNQKTGNSADINLILMHMLSAIGIKVSPVLISTRDNGKPLAYSPILSQFNHMIVVAEQNQESQLLDVVGDGAGFDVLPAVDINGQGFVVRKDKWGWMPILSSDKLFRQTYSRIDLQPKGDFWGQISVRNEGYTAARERRRLDQYPNRERYVREHVLTGLPGAKIDDHLLKNEGESAEPFIARCNFSAEEARFVEVAGDYLFFKPLLTRLIPENPFQEVEREHPLDLAVPTNERYVLALIIPEGFEVVQLPPPIHVKLAGESGSFTYQSQVVGPFLQLVSTITLEKTVFMPDEYAAVRSFFDYIVDKHSESIVFKKSEGEIIKWDTGND